MDMSELCNRIEEKLNVKVSIRFKTIYRGQKIPKVEGEKPVQAFYVKLELRNFKINFNNIVAIFGRTTSGFDDRYKMHFFTYPNLVKSDNARGAL